MKPPNKKELNRWLAEEFLGWELSHFGDWIDRNGFDMEISEGHENFFNLEGRRQIENELIRRKLTFETGYSPNFDEPFYAKIGTSFINPVSDKCKYAAFYTAIYKYYS